MISFRETLAWMLMATACLGWRIWVLGINIDNDGYQYLSVANNIATGKGISTSIPFYETELRHGIIPAPSTHFPPGYSLLITALFRMASSREKAGCAVSFLAFIALIPLCMHLARRVGIQLPAVRIFLVLLCVNQALLTSASSVASEPIFTAMTMVALLLIQYSQTATKGSMAAAVLGGAMAAGSYWIRYAGLFMILMLALLCVFSIQRRRPQLIRAATSLLTALLCMAPILARNEILVGSWRGYITKNMFHPAGIGKLFVVSIYHLFFGSGLAIRTMPFAFICLLCLITLGVAAVRRPGQHPPLSASVPALYAAVYTAGMIYLGITSDIGFGVRMFIPLLPVLLLLGAAVFSRWQTSINRAAVTTLASIMVIVYTLSNLLGSSSTKTPSPHLNVQAAVSGNLKIILDGDPTILVSADGQAAGYGLDRPVVGLVGPDYGNTHWTEQEVHDLMLHYGSRHLLLFPGTNTEDGQQTSEFLRALAAGKHPSWLQPQAMNDRAILYELRRPI